MSAVVGARAVSPWSQRLVVLVVFVVATLLLYRDTAAAMVEIWLRSETFAHCLLVPPISAWLIWRRRADISAQQPATMPWLLLPMAVAGLFWLLGNLATVNAVSQFMLVTVIVLLVPAFVGWPATRTMLFPLGFLYFAVPIGEFLMPWLMESTADFTVSALVMTGIPVYREGHQFIIPSGAWSVVEACSGVRYLIASLMVGALFAYLNYRSMRRRWMFMGVALVVPIVANWVRAYLIVLLGHVSNNKLAAGADHLIYGWVFFGVVILLMFMIGARWSEPESAPAAAIATGSGRSGERLPWPMPLAVVGVLLLPVLALNGLLAHESRVVPQLGEPAARWRSADPPTSWQPEIEKPAAKLQRGYAATAEPASPSVGLFIGYFRQQSADSKLVSSNNQLVRSTDRDWALADAGLRHVALGAGAELPVRTASLRRPVGQADATRLRVWQLYWVNGRYTVDDSAAKAYVALHRLLGRGDDGAVLVFHAVESPTGSADALLEAFLRDNFDAIDAELQKVRDGR
ncbi:MAG: exosortase A [Burkholderiaceae bacterium]|nr:exosortase A [Burkholderiaceae bacterium]